jgi:hypothetical protein
MRRREFIASVGAIASKGIANTAQLNDALVAIKQSGATVLIVQPSPFTYGQRGQIISAAVKYDTDPQNFLMPRSVLDPGHFIILRSRSYPRSMMESGASGGNG